MKKADAAFLAAYNSGQSHYQPSTRQRILKETQTILRRFVAVEECL